MSKRNELQQGVITFRYDQILGLLKEYPKTFKKIESFFESADFIARCEELFSLLCENADAFGYTENAMKEQKEKILKNVKEGIVIKIWRDGISEICTVQGLHFADMENVLNKLVGNLSMIRHTDSFIVAIFANQKDYLEYIFEQDITGTIASEYTSWNSRHWAFYSSVPNLENEANLGGQNGIIRSRKFITCFFRKAVI